jgi:thiol-disulfide isomerase/thioredoxin
LLGPGNATRAWAVLAAVSAGVIAVIIALVLATGVGLWWRRRDGQVRAQPGARREGQPAVGGAGAGAGAGAGQPDVRPDSQTVGDPDSGYLDAGRLDGGPGLATATMSERPVTASGELTSADLRAPLGERATLVQFSSAFCAPCRATRRVLADVAGMVDGVSHVEIDAESRLDLVRRLDVRRTPTTFFIGPDGYITHRASGQPRKADVIAALGAMVEFPI